MEKVTSDILHIGINDREIDLFEGIYDVPAGIAYNTYVILDDKVAVTDTVDAHFGDEWFDELDKALGGRTPDYLIIDHMEPDHSANIARFAQKYKTAKLVGNAKTFAMTAAFFGTDYADRRIVVADGDTLELGRHVLKFVFAPMVHWPEVMLTYDTTDRILFSADAFGKFGALDCDEPWEPEARRYYYGIVGKYGVQVQNTLKKLAGVDISVICPLHGPVLKSNLAHYVGLYDTWSKYMPETDGVMIAYTSVYGHTKAAVEELKNALEARGVSVTVYDLARCDMSVAVADAFRHPKLVLATTTYNMEVFPPMRTFIDCLAERAYKNRTVALIENGSWAPAAAKLMRMELEKLNGIAFTPTTVTVRSALNADTRAAIENLAEELK